MADAIRTSLVYIERDGKYLMLYRNRKKNDLNAGKWVGVGGKFEPGETPEACAIRETREETGLTLLRPIARGIVTFESDRYPTEDMYLFTCTEFSGTLRACDEGDLSWIEKSCVPTLPLWEGDRIFLSLLALDAPFFSLTLVYRGEELVRATLDGRELPL